MSNPSQTFTPAHPGTTPTVTTPFIHPHFVALNVMDEKGAPPDGNVRYSARPAKRQHAPMEESASPAEEDAIKPSLKRAWGQTGGAYAKELRRENPDISIEELAEKSGLKPATLSRGNAGLKPLSPALQEIRDAVKQFSGESKVDYAIRVQAAFPTIAIADLGRVSQAHQHILWSDVRINKNRLTDEARDLRASCERWPGEANLHYADRLHRFSPLSSIQTLSQASLTPQETIFVHAEFSDLLPPRIAALKQRIQRAPGESHDSVVKRVLDADSTLTVTEIAAVVGTSRGTVSQCPSFRLHQTQKDFAKLTQTHPRLAEETGAAYKDRLLQTLSRPGNLSTSRTQELRAAVQARELDVVNTTNAAGSPHLLQPKSEPMEFDEVVFQPQRHRVNNELPILRHPDFPARSMLLEAEGDLKNITVRNWGSLHDNFQTMTAAQVSAAKQKIAAEVQDWLSEEGAHNARFEKLMSSHIPLDDDEGDRGFTLAAKTDLPALTLLGPYAGRLLTNEEEHIQDERRHGRIAGNYFFQTASAKRTISAYAGGNLLSLMNSPTFRERTPETIAKANVACFLLGKNLIFYITSRAVRAGEELLLDYGAGYKHFGVTPPKETVKQEPVTP